MSMNVIASSHCTAPAGRALLVRVDAAMLDLDGTLVNTLGDFSEAVNRMLADLGLPAIPAGEIARRVGKGSEHLLHSVLNWALAQADKATAAINIDAIYPHAWERYQHHYEAINGQYATVYPGVPEGLALLRGVGLPLVCLTNKPRAHALALLRAKALDGWFEEVFGGDSFARKKPDPLPLLKACEWLGTPPVRTLMVGDSSNDARAARAAGCPVVLLTYGYNHGVPVREVDADGFVDDLTELMAVL